MDVKEGDILIAGEGESYIKIKVLPNKLIYVLEGKYYNSILSLKEWVFMYEPLKATIQNITDIEKCQGCPFYIDSVQTCSSASSVTRSVSFRRESQGGVEIRTIEEIPKSQSNPKKQTSWFDWLMMCGLNLDD